MLSLLACDIEEIKGSIGFEPLYSRLTPSRRKRTDRYRAPDDKYRAAAAECLLRCSLSRVGADGDLSDLAEGANGKPYLSSRPDVHFNISHSGALVICAVSDFEVGCDVQEISRIRPDISRRFSVSEQELIARIDDINERAALCGRYWVIKESFLKCLGTGLTLPMDAFSVDINDCSICYDGARYRFSEIKLREGYNSAVCIRADLTPTPVPEWISPAMLSAP